MANKMTVLGVMFFDNHISPGYYFSYGTARTVEEREAALAKVEPFQQGDFEAMYRIMGERPMTIRYLDSPQPARPLSDPQLRRKPPEIPS